MSPALRWLTLIAAVAAMIAIAHRLGLIPRESAVLDGPTQDFAIDRRDPWSARMSQADHGDGERDDEMFDDFLLAEAEAEDAAYEEYYVTRENAPEVSRPDETGEQPEGE